MKKRKLTRKEAEAKASYDKLVAKWSGPQFGSRGPLPSVNKIPVYSHRTSNVEIKSTFATGKADTSKKESMQYTGNAIVGIATLHKSNGVPVFSKEDAIDISKMRRG